MLGWYEDKKNNDIFSAIASVRSFVDGIRTTAKTAKTEEVEEEKEMSQDSLNLSLLASMKFSIKWELAVLLGIVENETAEPDVVIETLKSVVGHSTTTETQTKTLLESINAIENISHLLSKSVKDLRAYPMTKLRK